MGKTINKKKLIKYAATGLVSIAIGSGIGLSIYDSNIDHLEVYCPLNQIFGVEHQINKINSDFVAYGIGAYHSDAEEELKTQKIKLIPMYTDDGRKVYEAPQGYMIKGEYAVRTVYECTPESIVIASGTPIYPEGAKPGDLVRKSDIKIEDFEDLYSIPVPQKTR